ncbi:MAG: response regulator [Methylococcaceae bacterium]
MLINTPTLKKLNLLLVDDNIEAAALLHQQLSKHFNTVHIAHSVYYALQLYREQNIDLIITETKMRHNNGLSLIERIRKDDSKIAVIILTALNDMDYLFRAANLQVEAYMMKPLNFEKLNIALQRISKRLNVAAQPVKNEKKESVFYAISDDVFYHLIHKKLIVKGKEVSLGRKESLLLELLMFSKNCIVSKAEMAKVVWRNQRMTESALKNLLVQLRRKLQYNIIKNQSSRGWYIDN